MSDETKYYDDYPSEPIGGKNPYCRCSSCGRSAPEINGSIEGHLEDCPWRIQKKKELDIKRNKMGETRKQEFIDRYIVTFLATWTASDAPLGKPRGFIQL